MKINKNNVMGSIIVALIVLLSCLPPFLGYCRKQKAKNDEADGSALRSVVAEAYININEDPDFVNTATANQPMEVPEKYYTYVESVQGDGRVYVFVYANGSVDAYFGTPEKTVDYYLDICG